MDERHDRWFGRSFGLQIIIFSNSKFEGTNIIANTNPTINMQSPELIQTVIDNQTKISQLIESQNMSMKRTNKEIK